MKVIIYDLKKEYPELYRKAELPIDSIPVSWDKNEFPFTSLNTYGQFPLMLSDIIATMILLGEARIHPSYEILEKKKGKASKIRISGIRIEDIHHKY